jgi:hypothetical protein
MFGRRRFSQFLSLASPLMVGAEDGPRVLLAFVLTGSGDLAGMTVGTDGGRVSFDPVETLIFPSPIRLGTVASGSETLGGNRETRRQRRADA